MIVFVHTKFGLVRVKGSGVKRGGRIPPPHPVRVFEIPAWIGLIGNPKTNIKMRQKVY